VAKKGLALRVTEERDDAPLSDEFALADGAHALASGAHKI
jgi:hypothetical protein